MSSVEIITCPNCKGDWVEDDGDCFVCFNCLTSGESDELIVSEVDINE